MRRALLLALAALLVLTPGAAAERVERTVYLHDLVENGAYVGCHVTNAETGGTNYRLTVKEGDEIVLTARASGENTNAHTLSVDEHAGPTRPLTAGGTDTLTFTASRSGSFAMLCDETPNPSLQGLLIVQKAPTPPPETKDAPAPLALLALAALAAAAAGRRRA